MQAFHSFYGPVPAEVLEMNRAAARAAAAAAEAAEAAAAAARKRARVVVFELIAWEAAQRDADYWHRSLLEADRRERAFPDDLPSMRRFNKLMRSS